LGKTTKAREEVRNEVMKKLRFGLMVAFILGLILIGYLGAVNLPAPGRPPHDGQEMIRIPSPDELRTYFMVRTIVSTVNAGLVLYLLIVYVGIYLRIRAKFTAGLIIFAITLFLYAITSNPLVHFLFPPYTLNLFDALPELFTTVAVVVLLYLSLK
jgi:hypothetical protein